MKLARTKEWRESHGLTQRELAAEAGVGEVTVARIETGASVSPPTARKVAEALGVSVADLLDRPPVPLAEASKETGPSQPGPEDARYAGIDPFEAFGIALAAMWDEDLKEWEEKIPEGELPNTWAFGGLIQWSLEIAGTKAAYKGVARSLEVPLRADTLRRLDEADRAATSKVIRTFEPLKTFKEFQKIWEASDMDAVVNDAQRR